MLLPILLRELLLSMLEEYQYRSCRSPFFEIRQPKSLMHYESKMNEMIFEFYNNELISTNVYVETQLSLMILIFHQQHNAFEIHIHVHMYTCTLLCNFWYHDETIFRSEAINTCLCYKYTYVYGMEN